MKLKVGESIELSLGACYVTVTRMARYVFSATYTNHPPALASTFHAAIGRLFRIRK